MTSLLAPFSFGQTVSIRRGYRIGWRALGIPVVRRRGIIRDVVNDGRVFGVRLLALDGEHEIVADFLPRELAPVHRRQIT